MECRRGSALVTWNECVMAVPSVRSWPHLPDANQWSTHRTMDKPALDKGTWPAVSTRLFAAWKRVHTTGKVLIRGYEW